jgi:hypothetical protein
MSVHQLLYVFLKLKMPKWMMLCWLDTSNIACMLLLLEFVRAHLSVPRPESTRFAVKLEHSACLPS